MESDILLAPTLRARWSKSLSLSCLLGSSPNPRQSADARLSEHHKIVVATLRLKSKRERFALEKAACLRLFSSST